VSKVTSGRKRQLVGELAGQPGGANLTRHCLGVVLDPVLDDLDERRGRA
jgi:hypothetical protein